MKLKTEILKTSMRQCLNFSMLKNSLDHSEVFLHCVASGTVGPFLSQQESSGFSITKMVIF